MSKFKTNNYDQAFKEISSMDKKQAEKLNEVIEGEKESKMYHVALVKITTVEGAAQNDVNVQIQQYHPNGFEKIKKNFAFHGFTKIVVVHDPSQKVEKAGQKKSVKPAPTENNGKEPTEGQKAANPETNEAIEIGNEVVKNGTVDDLDAFAKDYGIADYPIDKNKPTKVDAIKAWLKTGIE